MSIAAKKMKTSNSRPVVDKELLVQMISELSGEQQERLQVELEEFDSEFDRTHDSEAPSYRKERSAARNGLILATVIRLREEDERTNSTAGAAASAAEVHSRVKGGDVGSLPLQSKPRESASSPVRVGSQFLKPKAVVSMPIAPEPVVDKEQMCGDLIVSGDVDVSVKPAVLVNTITETVSLNMTAFSTENIVRFAIQLEPEQRLLLLAILEEFEKIKLKDTQYEKSSLSKNVQGTHDAVSKPMISSATENHCVQPSNLLVRESATANLLPAVMHTPDNNEPPDFQRVRRVLMSTDLLPTYVAPAQLIQAPNVENSNLAKKDFFRFDDSIAPRRHGHVGKTLLQQYKSNQLLNNFDGFSSNSNQLDVPRVEVIQSPNGHNIYLNGGYIYRNVDADGKIKLSTLRDSPLKRGRLLTKYTNMDDFSQQQELLPSNSVAEIPPQFKKHPTIPVGSLFQTSNNQYHTYPQTHDYFLTNNKNSHYYELSEPVSQISQTSQYELSTPENQNIGIRAFLLPPGKLSVSADSNGYYSNYFSNQINRAPSSVVSHNPSPPKYIKSPSKSGRPFFKRSIDAGEIDRNEFQNRKMQRIQAILHDLRKK